MCSGYKTHQPFLGASRVDLHVVTNIDDCARIDVGWPIRLFFVSRVLNYTG